MKQPCHTYFALAGLLFFLFCAPIARANVYATDIQLNGSSQMAVVLPGENLTVSYILNDNATGGVWVEIYSGTNLVQTLASTNDEAGTNVGTNIAVWDGVTNLAEGVYTVAITAASTGYCTWTNITDNSSNFHVVAPHGICVDNNTNSPYYGRVFIASAPNPTEAGNGAPSGIFKRNADGSPAESGFSNGGWSWGDSGFAPWNMAMGPDDRVYVDDFTDQGIVLSFNPTLDSTSRTKVLGTNNYPPGYPYIYLGGLAITGPATDMQLWMSDSDFLSGDNPYGSSGINGWQITDGATATNDTGYCVAPVEAEFLSQAPYNLSVDTNGFLYAVQYDKFGDGPAYALMSFPPYTGEPENVADWAVAMFPELVDVYGVAADPDGKLVAVGTLGESNDTEGKTGGLYLFRGCNGDYVTNLDHTGGDPYFGVTWDNVGNLYALDGVPSNAVWRVYSPPGTNQATTTSVAVMQTYDSLQPPSLNSPAMQGAELHLMLCGQSNVTYVIEHSCDLSMTNWCYTTNSFSTNANRPVCVPVCGTQNFYRARSMR